VVEERGTLDLSSFLWLDLSKSWQARTVIVLLHSYPSPSLSSVFHISHIMKQYPRVLEGNEIKKVSITYPSSSLVSAHGLEYLSQSIQRSVNKIWKDLRTVPKSFITAYIESLTSERAIYVIVFGYGIEDPKQEFVKYEVDTYELTHNLTPERVIKEDE